MPKIQPFARTFTIYLFSLPLSHSPCIFRTARQLRQEERDVVCIAWKPGMGLQARQSEALNNERKQWNCGEKEN